mmetsp:Transcript_8434/g.21629  ORF Transcript_8434/g.21629 Transcript_8434/m.21629 type:complete len:205 (+) Transcript_8434:1245-1859(+)
MSSVIEQVIAALQKAFEADTTFDLLQKMLRGMETADFYPDHTTELLVTPEDVGVFEIVSKAQRGDQIVVQWKSINDGEVDIAPHFGIFAGMDEHKLPWMIDMCPTSDTRSTYVKRITLEDFLSHENRSLYKLGIVRHLTAFEKEFSASLAEAFANLPVDQQPAYHFFGRNCEVFSYFCRTGRCVDVSCHNWSATLSPFAHLRGP